MKVAIIGGTGRMGRWFARYFVANSHQVGIFGRDSKKTKHAAKSLGVNVFKSIGECCKDADLIVVSVPIDATPEIIQQVAPKLNKGKTVIEVASIKGEIIALLGKIKNASVISVHPLFGPGANIRSTNRYALIPVGNAEEEKTIFKNLFPRSEIIVVQAEEHDIAMAKVLSLTHFVNALFLKTLGNVTKLSKLSGTTFGIQLALAMGVMHDEPSQLAALQVQNPHFKKVLQVMIKSAKEWQSFITKGRQEELSAQYNQIRAAIEKERAFRDSYEKMYAMFRSLQKDEH